MTINARETIETKAETGEARRAVAEFLNAFEAFKAANDARLAEIEAKSAADPLLSEKVDRLNAALDAQKSTIDRLALAGRRPALGAPALGVQAPGVLAPGVSKVTQSEEKAAFARYIRAGEAPALEEKALSVGSDPNGGYLAPDETARVIDAAVRDVSPIRAIASVRAVGANSFRTPVSLSGPAAGWAAETAARAETATPTLQAIDFPTMELYAMPAASQALLDDAVVDIEQWLADEVQAEFAAQETAAFVSGNGTTQPRGFLTETQSPEASRASDEVGYLATGVDGAFPASDAVDVLLDLVYAPKQTYRAGARFAMNRATLGAVRKLKDADGAYVWQPSLEAGAPSSLLGFPVTEIEEMPSIEAGETPIAFGDFRRFYLVVDRQGVRILRDPYSSKPYVLFYTTKRVGGGVQDFDAVKLLKFSAS
ncbi:MAG: phage major capsid protein [Parvularculaceae bacterium]